MSFQKELRRSAIGRFNIVQTIMQRAAEEGYMGPKDSFVESFTRHIDGPGHQIWTKMILKLDKLQAMFKTIRIVVSRYLRQWLKNRTKSGSTFYGLWIWNKNEPFQSPDLLNQNFLVENQLNQVNGDEFRIRQLYRKERLLYIKHISYDISYII